MPLRRFGGRRRAAGAASPAVALGGILLATLLDPTFSWTGDALSDLGVRAPSALAFNGALIVGGLLGLPYAHLLSERGGRAVGVAFGVGTLCLAGVGLFPSGTAPHAPVAVGFFLLATVAVAVDGAARREEPTGRLSLALAAGHVLAWVTWGAGLWPATGLALPEFVGAMIVAAWVWLLGPVPALVDGKVNGGG
ncbi:DUF998 domain-containing protein [Haloparvum sedimenti]|uniref:DUF998 domain-containing protein n=1 Tax=Haloparvum sedimenti TaxID=1678448 RepID=UPI0009B5B5D6|nr:DUF998 domain-containing protein [Haloparvum sedimenti]